MKRPLRAIHCSDLHFDWRHIDFDAETVRRIAHFATRWQADVVLLAGDIFDSGDQPEFLAERLAPEFAAIEAPIVAIRGNHDVIYRPGDADAITSLFGRLGPSAHFISEDEGRAVMLAEGAIRAWGRGMPEHSRANNPLNDLPSLESDGAWNIVLAHGTLTEQPAARSSEILLHRHAEAMRSVHYLALGHVHAPRTSRFGNTVVQYSGSASGVDGDGTVALAEFDGQDTRVEVHTLRESAEPTPWRQRV